MNDTINLRECCLLCHWEPDKEKGTHLPLVIDESSGVYVCADCDLKRQTVNSFGLTADELRKAAHQYKKTLYG